MSHFTLEASHKSQIAMLLLIVEEAEVTNPEYVGTRSVTSVVVGSVFPANSVSSGAASQ